MKSSMYRPHGKEESGTFSLFNAIFFLLVFLMASALAGCATTTSLSIQVPQDEMDKILSGRPAFPSRLGDVTVEGFKDGNIKADDPWREGTMRDMARDVEMHFRMELISTLTKGRFFNAGRYEKDVLVKARLLSWTGVESKMASSGEKVVIKYDFYIPDDRTTLTLTITSEAEDTTLDKEKRQTNITGKAFTMNISRLLLTLNEMQGG